MMQDETEDLESTEDAEDAEDVVIPVIENKNDIEITEETFDHLGLSQPILDCIKQVGFTHPTPIQKAVIPTALTGRDMIGLAQTGSGKTAAFVIPLAERLTHGKGVRGLILCPTREIALQTKAFLDLFGSEHHLKTACLIGGVKMGGQLKELKENPDIIVATPGRLIDHATRKTVSLSHVEELVLDEADHMLDMGFLPQIHDILRLLPKKRHSVMFSATMPAAIERLANQFLKDPLRIDILPPGRAAVNITHQLFMVEREDKKDCLLGILKAHPGATLVFSARKLDVDWLSRVLETAGVNVGRIHSGLSQSERTTSLSDFRESKNDVLLATDIAARGIDVPGISHVINFDIPDNVEDYIHRSGRTARASASGLVSTIASWQDHLQIKAIEAALGIPLPRCTVEGVKPFVEFQPKKSTSRRRR